MSSANNTSVSSATTSILLPYDVISHVLRFMPLRNLGQLILDKDYQTHYRSQLVNEALRRLLGRRTGPMPWPDHGERDVLRTLKALELDHFDANVAQPVPDMYTNRWRALWCVASRVTFGGYLFVYEPPNLRVFRGGDDTATPVVTLYNLEHLWGFDQRALAILLNQLKELFLAIKRCPRCRGHMNKCTDTLCHLRLCKEYHAF